MDPVAALVELLGEAHDEEGVEAVDDGRPERRRPEDAPGVSSLREGPQLVLAPREPDVVVPRVLRHLATNNNSEHPRESFLDLLTSSAQGYHYDIITFSTSFRLVSTVCLPPSSCYKYGTRGRVRKVGYITSRVRAGKT